MLKEMQKRMEELHMVAPGDKVLVAVSGGADSLCLLIALHALKQEMCFELEVVHVEHGIRGEESVADAKFVENVCKELNVPCQIYHVDVPTFAEEHGLGHEEAARRLRYEVFEKLASEKKAKVALAHHQEDNAETILFQMVRGSSLTGLCGMQAVRSDDAGICYIRPLLTWHREDIEAYLKEQEISWRVDSTNAQIDYSRNYLRAKVIPELTKINTQAVEHMNQTASHLSEIKDFLDLETERLWETHAKVTDKIRLDANQVQMLHPVMQRQLIYKAITETAGRKKDITSTHVDDVLALCKGQSGKRISLPYAVVATKEFDWICLEVMQADDSQKAPGQIEHAVKKEDLQTMFDAFVNQEKEAISAKENVIEIADARFVCRILKKTEETLEIPRKTYTKWLDYDKIKQGFCIRTRRSGDYFICDTDGHRKNLKEYFTDEKIPVAERDQRWLLAKEQEVLWFVGGRISESVKVTTETKYIFEITYDGGKTNE